jgi:hypothetical protein
LDPFVFSSGPD